MTRVTLKSIPKSCIIVIFISVENELLILPDHVRLPAVLVRFVLLSLCSVYCRSLYDSLFCFYWWSCCKAFPNLRLLITALVSSKFFLIFFILSIFINSRERNIHHTGLPSTQNKIIPNSHSIQVNKRLSNMNHISHTGFERMDTSYLKPCELQKKP